MSIVKEMMLNFASVMGNNNKFYHIILTDNGGSYEVLAKYGRVGNSPQRTSKSFGSSGQAEVFYNKKVSEKKSKGYVQIELEGLKSDVSNTGKASLNRSSDISDLKKVKDIDDKTALVYRMLNNFLTSSRGYIKKHIDLPLGSLTKNQINKGYEILDKIQSHLTSNAPISRNLLINLTDEFYRAFPIVFNRVGNKESLIIDDIYKVGNKRELVDIAKSVLLTSKIDDISDVYDSLKMKINPLRKGTKKYGDIVDKFHKTHSDNHRFRMGIENVYEVTKPEWDNEFNPHKCRVNLLYHGSRTENFLNILQNGLKIKPPGAAHTGSMFGNGIYFADQSSKSANYCWGFNRNTGTYYMLVCEVAVGKMYDLESSNSSLRCAPAGYNSVRGVKGRSLQHNEVIVYKEDQANIRYIIEFKTF